MRRIASAYKRLYDGFNYRLRTLAGGRWAAHCRPTSIAIGVTGRCNAKCIHCDIWQNRGPEETPTVDQWRVVLTDLRRWLGPVQVIFTGGEALMQKFTIDLVRHAVDAGLLVEVFSNGYWNDQTRIERLAATNPWRITVSLDGIGDAHSLVRGRTDFFEKTERSLHTLDRLRREDGLAFKLRLKTVVMNQNLDSVVEVAHYADRAGWEVFYQPIEQNYNSPEDAHWFEHSDTWPSDPVRAISVVDQLISLKREGLPIANSFAQLDAMGSYFLDPGALRLVTQAHAGHESRRLCSALTNLEMRADGSVYTCARMAPIGNIKERPIRKLWEQRPQWWREGCCLENKSSADSTDNSKGA
jgi:MoaA/NifB/PqqE/SkfB family radical SAM enzyme